MIDIALKMIAVSLITLGIIGFAGIFYSMATGQHSDIDVCEFRHWGSCTGR